MLVEKRRDQRRVDPVRAFGIDLRLELDSIDQREVGEVHVHCASDCRFGCSGGVATEEAELFDQQLWIEDNLGRALAKMMDRISSSGLSISGIDKLLTRRNKTLMEYATQVMQKRFGA